MATQVAIERRRLCEVEWEHVRTVSFPLKLFAYIYCLPMFSSHIIEELDEKVYIYRARVL